MDKCYAKSCEDTYEYFQTLWKQNEGEEIGELTSLYEFNNYLRYSEYDPNQPNKLTCLHDSGIFAMPLDEDLGPDLEEENEVFNFDMLDYKERQNLFEIDYFKLWGTDKILLRFFNCIKVFEMRK